MMLIIDNYDSFTYNLYQLFAVFVKDIRVFRNDAITVQEVLDLNPGAIVISPGPKDPASAGICVDLIRTAAFRIPILGVCLGMQAIGMAFGADVIRAPKPMHGKTSVVFHHGNGIYKTMPQPFRAGRYHSLVVDETTLPQELIKESITEDGLLMGIRHREFPCFGVQFHPESVMTEEGSCLLKNFSQIAFGISNKNMI